MSDGGAQHIVLGPYFTSAGVLYPDIEVYLYDVGTSNAKTAWSDEDKQTAVAQPFIGDDTGVARFFADGDYKIVVKNTGSTLTLYTWDSVKITSDTSTMWEGNFGTSYPSATTANRWQMFAKVTAGNKLVFVGINNGTKFVDIARPVGLGADIISASALPVINDGDYADVTGVVTITSFAAVGVGTRITLQFDGALILTHHATNLILPNGVDIVTQAGSVYTFVEYATGDWRLVGGSSDSPSFSVHRDGVNQTNISGSTDKVEWTTEIFDTNNNFDKDTNFRFTPTVSGKYLLSATIRWSSVTANDRLSIFIYKNGSEVARYYTYTQGVEETETVTIVVDANGTGDYFEVFAGNIDRDTSTIVGTQQLTYFTGCRIG